jgi:hypothetical protein
VTIVPTPPTPYLAHSPAAVPLFVNRQRELGELSRWASDSTTGSTMTVVGLGGMGKTALAWHWFQRGLSDGDFDGRMWWSFYEDDSQRFFSSCYAYLNNGSIAESNLLGRGSLVRAIAARLRSGRFLLVLDGLERHLVAYSQSRIDANLSSTSHRLRSAATIEMSEFLRRTVETDSRSKILLTSRVAAEDLEDSHGEPVPGTRILSVEGLDEASARQLLGGDRAGTNSDELRHLAKELGYHPLSLSLVAHLIERDPRALPWLRRRLESNSAPGVGFAVSGGLEDTIQNLPGDELELATAIAEFTGQVQYAALVNAVVGLDKRFIRESELDKALTHLQDIGFVTWNQRDNTYSMHPMVRGIIARMAAIAASRQA